MIGTAGALLTSVVVAEQIVKRKMYIEIRLTETKRRNKLSTEQRYREDMRLIYSRME